MNPSGIWEYQARLLHVVDADTVDLEVDLGFSIWMKMRIRLYGINAPELYTPEGQTSREQLLERVPEGSPLKLVSIKDSKDKYGRYLGVLFDPEGTNLNDWLVEAELAVRALY